jgi:ribose 5-phosphate isomerase B
MEVREKIIAMGSDHGGYEMKEYIKHKLVSEGHKVKDFGTYSEESVDYPDYIHPLADAVNKEELDTAIIMCGSGNGAQITANKYPKVRAALCWNKELTKLAREHNNANVLSLPGRFIPLELAWEMVQIFLSTDFEGGRHERRVEKISQFKK